MPPLKNRRAANAAAKHPAAAAAKHPAAQPVPIAKNPAAPMAVRQTILPRSQSSP